MRSTYDIQLVTPNRDVIRLPGVRSVSPYIALVRAAYDALTSGVFTFTTPCVLEAYYRGKRQGILTLGPDVSDIIDVSGVDVTEY